MLSALALRSVSVADMEPPPTEKELIRKYIVARLTRENNGRGFQAKLAKATGFTTAHISNVLSKGASIGDDFKRAMAKYWGISVDQLEAEAGVEIPASPGRESRVVFDERYPARAEAIALVRDLVRPAAIDAAMTICRQEASQWDREDWMREIHELDKERKKFEAGQQADVVGGEELNPRILDLHI